MGAGPEHPRCGYWVPSSERDGAPVLPTAVSEATRKHLRGLGIGKGSSRRLRALYGTDLLRSGTNIRVLQELMHLSSLATAEHYLLATEDEQRVGILGLVA